MIKIMLFGTFDIFHKGHKNFLKQAREYGDYLIVVVARDETVEKVKKRLPQNDEGSRLEIIRKSDLADEAVLGSLKNKYKAIEKYKPNVICLGYDQKTFTENLREKLKEFNLSDTKIVYLRSYYPEKYKSSKLRKSIKKMKIVICGSMIFSRSMIDIEKELLEFGHAVVIPRHTGEYAELKLAKEVHSESVKNKVKNDLIRDYFDKIKNSDAVLVVNKDKNKVKNYIGGNSFLEMGFAYILNKKIFFLNGIQEMIYTDEIEAMQPIVLNGDLTKIS